MKKLFAMLCLFASVAFAQPIRVQGIGNNFEQAKESAFKSAIELRLGSTLTTELETMNGKLIRNDILNYSAGYIESYKVIETFTSSNQTYVIADVSISSSRIQDRILGVASASKQFEGDKHSTQYLSYVHSKEQGDKMLGRILNDFPSKAFTITQGQHKLAVDVYRMGMIEIPVELRWNHNYLVALNELLDKLEDGRNGLFAVSPGNITVMSKDPRDYFGRKSTYRFNDLKTVEEINNAVFTKEPWVLVSMYSHDNKVLLEKCYIPDGVSGKGAPFYRAKSDLILYGFQVEKNIIKVKIENLNNIIQHIQRIEVSVVSSESCP